MTQEKISAVSAAANLLLTVSKLAIGLFINSAALIAEGIHSALDVCSSLVTFLGIKAAAKPVDEKHPYGHYRMESLAGIVVTILLIISAAWILCEAISHFIKTGFAVFSLSAIFLMVFSMLVNEILARLKFRYGQEYGSLSLVADAEHSRADVLSSGGVLLSLAIVDYFPLADPLVALLIGLYILKKSFTLSREITDSLLDVRNFDLEARIQKICEDEQINMSSLKTRKIGAANFAEIKIKLDPRLKVDEASVITRGLEEKLVAQIPELKYVVISVESHEFKKGTIVPFLGKRYDYSRGIRSFGPAKAGKRIVIPVENGEISRDHFGTKKYLLVDVGKENELLRKEFIENPYYTEDRGHGVMLIRSVSADEVVTKHIGERAKQNLSAFGVKIRVVEKNQTLGDLLEELKSAKSA